MNKKKISEIADEILDRTWFGPNGLCWCEEQQKYVDPDTCDCPECKSMRSQDIRQFRYLHLHDDYKSM
jgi:cytochrome c1